VEYAHPLGWLLPVGPRSVIFGAHQFVIHPIFLEVAWRKLYKLRPTWRQRVAFAVHDLGYLFQWCHDMDGEEGKRHPRWGAHLMHRLFDRDKLIVLHGRIEQSYYWHNFAAGHSRHYAELVDIDYSPLMRADKLATHLYPRWLYAFLMKLSGEWREYKDYWIRVGGYPGTAADGVWAYAGHLQSEWKRFDDLKGAIHGSNGGI
jgi:hypothetical protein